MHEPIENDPANWPSAESIIAVPNTDADAYDAYYVFEADYQMYSYDLLMILRERRYDAQYDPYADYRSIGAEYEGQLPADADLLLNFAGQSGLPITFLPDVTP
jgi:hypothetical protein